MTLLLYRIVRFIFNAVISLIVLRTFVSFMRIDKNHRLLILLFQITEPVLKPVRNVMNRINFDRTGMTFDLSPFILLILLFLLREVVLRIII